MANLTSVGPLEQVILSPSDLGLSAVTLAAERTSNTFYIKGWGQLHLDVFYTYSAATAVIVAVDFSPLASPSATDWTKEYDVSSAAAGVNTIVPQTYSRTTSAADQPIALPIVLTGGYCARVRVSGTGGGAGDLVSVYATLKAYT